MSTLHLVDPATRDAVSAMEPFDPASDLAEMRSTVLTTFADEPAPRQERMIPGPPGAPDIRVLIYRPDHPDKGRPAILFLHGGGFIAGAPDMMDTPRFKLAQDHGAVVVAPSYRLAPETPFPGPVEDCYAALAWLWNEADALGVDRTRIAVMGQSAGGGLAAALALLVRARGAFSLKAQFLIYPMLDPRTGTGDALADNPTTGEFGWTRAANRFGWNAMRGSGEIPVGRLGHFAPALAGDVSGLPPAFIAVGALDLFLEEDVAFALRLAQAGVPVATHVYPGAVHGFDMFSGALADEYDADLHAAIVRFLRA